MKHFLYPWSELNTHSPEDVLWRLCNLCLLACQVRVSLGNLGLSVKVWLCPFVDYSAFRSLWSWCLIMNPAWLDKGHCLLGFFFCSSLTASPWVSPLAPMSCTGQHKYACWSVPPSWQSTLTQGILYVGSSSVLVLVRGNQRSKLK